MTPDTSVPLVVGAGPVGLTMANELARHGVGCRIIDRSAKRSQTSKALAIFPRTLEVFETMGMADRFIAARPSTQRALPPPSSGRDRADRSHFRREPVSVCSGIAAIRDRTITRRNLVQLRDRSGARGRADGLTQTSDAVRAVLRHADGREETIETPWLIGCDGAHSTTRHAPRAWISKGAQYDESFILADVQLESDTGPRSRAPFPR